MNGLLGFVNFIVAHGYELVAGVVAVLGGVIAICMVIPGEQPEKFLKGVVAFIEKFSIKKNP